MKYMEVPLDRTVLKTEKAVKDRTSKSCKKN